MYTEPAVALDERVELASAEWLAESERFLGTRTRGLSLPAFSISERLDNPPPHLAASERDAPFGYTLRFAGDQVTAEPRPDERANCYRVADYTASVLYATIVYDGDAREGAVREAGHVTRMGLGDWQGRMPIDPISRLCGELHDHMAARTVNSPDIRHRAEALGLADNLSDLDERGYTILPGAFTEEFADELRAEAHRNHDAAPPDVGFRATMLLRRGRLWEEAVLHPWVLTLMEHLLGRGCLVYQSDTIIKGPGLDTHPGLHSDYGASRIPEPFPDYCLEATAVWAIDDFSLPNGPTVVMPGSVAKRSQAPKGATRDGTKPLVMERGSIALWHGGLWHGAMPRSAPGKRTSLHNAYCRQFMRPLERYDDIPQEIVDRNPPAFATLCGLDDAFGKSGDHGADFERLGYAAKMGYGATALPA
ncbi:MAG: phytanoyl-CoA dioxygenase family protein [Gammaproteobacteria bacterium]|nr:phytanoyl-CoA dioxygenase family protein [Gammaproteobacteria bacterium]